MSVWRKRLENDFQDLSRLVKSSHGVLQIITQSKNPPSDYVIEYQCRGIEKLKEDKPIFRFIHRVKIILGQNYPRNQPYVKFLTPIFHPNVYENNVVCLGDYWTMAETLPELVIRIGRLIQYDPCVLNLNSPALSKAAKWAKENQGRFPLDHHTFKVTSENSLSINWHDLA
jgi:ubiquitin-protein ligase